MNDIQAKGLGLALVTALISGVSVFANGLVVTGIDPLVHTTVKNSIVGLMILVVLIITGEGRMMWQLRGKDRLKLFTIGFIGGSIPFVLFFTGLAQIGGVHGALIHKTLIFWVALMAIPLLGERMNAKMSLGILLLYASNFVVGIPAFDQLSRGHWLVLAATVLWAVENVIAKTTLSDIPANVVVGSRMGLGSIFLIGILVVSGKAPLVAELTSAQWLLLAGVAMLLFGYVMTWYRALQLAPATQVAAILVGASVVTTLLDAVFVGKSVSTTMLGQIIFIVAGVWFVVMAATDQWRQRGSYQQRLLA
jgi:drug/metabolite transporter (DMT)-like permease